MARTFIRPAVAFMVCLALTGGLSAADWPQFRHDMGRTAATSESLPANLHLQWTRELPLPSPAFPGEVRLRYDATYEPVVVGKTMFVPSMVTDSVAALDTDSGQERWRFFAEAPVRFAPVVSEGRVYFVSDDGHLYCLDANDGRQLWKFYGAPQDKTNRKLMGNGRLVPLFPARGGPVVAEGIVYFAAGIWWGEGVFVHALDATSGKVIWSNLDSGRIEAANMDHGIAYYAGIAPQGYLAIVDNRLVVPCGSQLPAVLDLKTGTIGPYTMGWGGRTGLAKGSWFVAGVNKYLMHGGDIYDIQKPNDEKFREKRRNDFKKMLYPAGLTRLQIDRTNQKGLGHFRRPILTADVMYYSDKDIVAYDLTRGKVEERTASNNPTYRQNDKYPDKLRGVFPELWRLPAKTMVHIKAGNRLYGSRSNIVEAIDLPEAGKKPQIGWQAKVQGTPHSMLAADGKLFVVTKEGHIYAFGGEERSETPAHALPTDAAPQPDQWSAKAADILNSSDTSAGYILVLGVGSGRLAEELILRSNCNVIAVDPDAQKVADLRRKFHQAGMYGTRITILAGDPMSYPFPPYLASLIVSEDLAALGDNLAGQFVERLVPCLRPYGGTARLDLPDDKRRELVAAVTAAKPTGITAREAGGSVMIARVGALPDSADWSHINANAANTGASEDRFVKPPLKRLWFDGSFRWYRKPGSTVVRVVGGRVFIQSHQLRAIDVYTGRHLWQRKVPVSRPSGDTIVALEDALYLAGGDSCVALDPVTGEKVREIKLPEGVAGPWSMIRATGDSLVGACNNWLVCVNRHNGELIWKHSRKATIGCLALGGGRVYRADFVKKQRGQKPEDAPILALDVQTGKVLWQASGGSEIRYLESRDLLCTSSGVLQADDGKRIGNSAALMIAGDRLISGVPGRVAILDPKTGVKICKELNWNRRGCTSLRGSSNLLTTRYMGNAAYIDLATGQISSIWNIRAACSNNLFVANGVLNVPNLSGGCTCNYLPISQAFVPASAIDGSVGSEEKPKP